MSRSQNGDVKIPMMGRVGPGGMERFKPGDKPKNARGVTIRILKLYLRWGKTLVVGMGLIALSSVLSVMIPYYVGQTFNLFQQATRTVDFAALYWLLGIILGLYFSTWLLNTLNQWLMLRVSQKLVWVLRQTFFAKLQQLPLGYFDQHPHGETMSRLTNDIDSISSTIASATSQVMASALTLVGSVVVMTTMNLYLTLTVLLAVPLVSGLTNVVAKRSRAYFIAQSKALGRLNSQIEEHIQGLKIVKAFDRQAVVMQQFALINEELAYHSEQAQIYAGLMMPLMNVINNLIFALVAIVGGYLVIAQGLLIGTVVSFLSYAKQFAQPLNNIAGMFNTIQQALAGAERVFEVLDLPSETKDDPDAIELNNPQGLVEFRDVSFGYHPGHLILKKISFKVQPGEVIALVGATGAGKTTIVNLLNRFYDANEGTILIDNIDITHLMRHSLRRCFSVVLQETCLFSGTIMDNIRYAKPQASDLEVIQAAKLAHADEFITKLPKGYQTLVSGSSDQLSEGQKQLLAIARAVLSESPILMLDEATSSVDTKTEKEIQQALTHLMSNRTCFLVAHRLSTIKDADRIMVVANQQIIESGSHQQLMEQHGMYYQMVMSQTKAD